MKALILAAGRGTRIRSVHGERPKCLIRLNDNGDTILDQQIENLLSAGVSDIGIVVGYEMEQILEHVRRRHHGSLRRIRFFSNPLFAETNNIYSLWLARDWLKGDSFVCLNADVVFDARVLTVALNSRRPITMTVDPEWRDETMKVIVKEGKIVRMSKGIPREEFSGTYLGITAFSAAIHSRFFRNVEALIESGRVNDFFNTAVQQLADEGVHVSPSPTWGLPWAEIDDPGDLQFAREHVFPKLRDLSVAA
jgi:L-glutamine-phosphate cytidylyltransferase